VAAGSAGTDEKVIRERTDFAEVDDYNVLRFLVERSFKGFGELILFVHLKGDGSPHE
jgi:hypothetical protein